MSSSPSTTVVLPQGSPAWQRQAKLARLLSWLLLLYMAAEGAIAVVAAIVAGSVALLGLAPSSPKLGATATESSRTRGKRADPLGFSAICRCTCRFRQVGETPVPATRREAGQPTEDCW